MRHPREKEKALPEVQDMTERILYRLSLDPEARALAEKLLGRFRCLVGNLPASADHHHSEPDFILLVGSSAHRA